MWKIAWLKKMNAPRITGEHSKLLIDMVMRAFLLDVAIYTPTIKDFLLPLNAKFVYFIYA